MNKTISQNELNIFYSDLTYLFHNRINVYRKFIYTLNFYEFSILIAFLMYNKKECYNTLLSIYHKFYDFIKEGKIL